MRILRNIPGAIAVVILSFGAALGVMEFIDYWRAHNAAGFERAWADAGLTFTESITGAIDSIRRNYDRRLVLTGWAYDKELGELVSIFVFLNGKLEKIAVTKGARADVTNAIGRPAEQTKDVVFSGHTEKAIDCKLSSEFTVVAVNRKKQFTVLGRELLIPGCQG